MSANKTKRLTLVRHASAEQDADVRDFERPLSRKGHNEALEMARRFQERGLMPDLILASAATRTRETAETFAKVLGVAARLLQADDALYLAEGDYILRRYAAWARASGISWSSGTIPVSPPRRFRWRPRRSPTICPPAAR